MFHAASPKLGGMKARLPESNGKKAGLHLPREAPIYKTYRLRTQQIVCFQGPSLRVETGGPVSQRGRTICSSIHGDLLCEVPSPGPPPGFSNARYSTSTQFSGDGGSETQTPVLRWNLRVTLHEPRPQVHIKQPPPRVPGCLAPSLGLGPGNARFKLQVYRLTAHYSGQLFNMLILKLNLQREANVPSSQGH